GTERTGPGRPVVVPGGGRVRGRFGAAPVHGRGAARPGGAGGEPGRVDTRRELRAARDRVSGAVPRGEHLRALVHASWVDLPDPVRRAAVPVRQPGRGGQEGRGAAGAPLRDDPPVVGGPGQRLPVRGWGHGGG